MTDRKIKRVFWIVLDSFGIGEMPDANLYKDEGSNTLKAIMNGKNFNIPNLTKLGLFNIDGVDLGNKVEKPIASFARMAEASNGKDTTTGHWEMAGIISEKPFPTFPNGFPDDFLKEFSKKIGRGVLCNKPYSGTEVIKDYGKEHMESGDVIVYTSADSVFQVAAHNEIVSLEELYDICAIAREMLQGKDLAVGRVIARPFVGELGNFKRTRDRHDYALEPTGPTIMDNLVKNDLSSIGVGKIYDIFAGKSVEESHKIEDNKDGMNKTLQLMDKEFTGLCFVNLVDFDMIYGHRNDVDGYANSMTEFDEQLGQMMEKLNDDDCVIITADHGCDPSTPSTDHSREYVPMLIFGKNIKEGVDLKTRDTFADIGKTIGDIFGIQTNISGKSFYDKVIK